MPFVFGSYALDAERRELRRGDALVALEPGTFDLLLHLIRNRDHVVSKDELLEAVWGGRIVSESTLTSRINAARKAIGDSGERQDSIRTVPRKGIRFVAEVTEVATQGATPPPERPAMPLSDMPSIVVLPFQNMSGDPEQEYFADGMVEEIITALSRFHSLFVIARNSSFTYKGKAVDVKQVARELGVRYVLEGSVRKSGRKVRITGQLADGTSGTHLWAERFDGTLEDIFDLQDRVTASVVGAIEPRLLQAEIDRTRSKGAANLDAYDHLLRAYANFHLMTADTNEQALQHLNKALSIAPEFAAAAGLASMCCMRRVSQGWTETPKEDAREGCRLARVVADGEKNDPVAMANAAFAWTFFERDNDAGPALIDQALLMNRNSSVIWHADGWVRNYTDEPRQATLSFQHALRLSPLDPHAGVMTTGLAVAHFALSEFEEALRWARRAFQSNPKYATAHRTLIATLVACDRLPEARAATEAFVRQFPTFRISAWLRRGSPFSPRTTNALVDSFRRAGVPE